MAKPKTFGEILDADFERVLDNGITAWCRWVTKNTPPSATGVQSRQALKRCLKRAFDKW